MPCVSTFSSMFFIILILPSPSYLFPELQLDVFVESYLLPRLDVVAAPACVLLFWIENDQLVVVASVCTVLQSTTFLICGENSTKRWRESGRNEGGPESADSSFPSAVPDRSHWAGRLRQTSVSIFVFTSRVLWPCLHSYLVFTFVSLPQRACIKSFCVSLWFVHLKLLLCIINGLHRD